MTLLHQPEIVALMMRLFWDDAESVDETSTRLALPIFTEYRRGDVIYRSHSNYRSDGPWHDWCFVKWELEDGETIQGVVQILIFVEAPDGELYAVVHAPDTSRQEAHRVFCTLWPMEFQNRSTRPQLYVVSWLL